MTSLFIVSVLIGSEVLVILDLLVVGEGLACSRVLVCMPGVELAIFCCGSPSSFIDVTDVFDFLLVGTSLI